MTARSTVDTTAVHEPLNVGSHTISVRSIVTKPAGQPQPPPSLWVTKDFIVPAPDCNPVESLEEGVGGTRDMPTMECSQHILGPLRSRAEWHLRGTSGQLEAAGRDAFATGAPMSPPGASSYST